MVRILPLGDSITVGALVGGFSPGGYRAPLEKLLDSASVEFAFLGSGNENLSEGQREIWHEGHSGWSVLPGRGYPGIMENLPGWAANYEFAPDFVLLHLGVNDIHWPTPGDEAFRRYESLLAALAQTWPSAKIVTSTLLGAEELDMQQQCDVFNELLLSRQSALVVAPMHRVLRRPDHFWDSLHPNRAGHIAMAHCWFDTMRSSRLI